MCSNKREKKLNRSQNVKILKHAVTRNEREEKIYHWSESRSLNKVNSKVKKVYKI